MANTCGGCRDLGAHSRWCPEVVGPRAERMGLLSERIESLAIEAGTVSPSVANLLFNAAATLRANAQDSAVAWKSLNKEK